MLYPNTELFKTPNGKYLLDANCGEILQISEDVYSYLIESAVEQTHPEGNTPPLGMVDLHEQGYLKLEPVVKKIKHPYTDVLPVFLDRKMASMTLQLTQQCNFRCKYCIYSEQVNNSQRSHSTKKMDWPLAKKAIDFLWSHSVDSPRVNIALYGGEPLLEFELIKSIVAYAEELFVGKLLTFNMTTNGTLLTEEVIKYLNEKNIHLMISLDGPEEVNDWNRVFVDGRGTYNSVMKAINLVRQVAPQYAKLLQISMVIDPQNDFDCINSICIDGAELDRLNIQPTLIDHGYDYAQTVFSEEYEWKFEYQQFLAVLARFNCYPETSISPIAQRAIQYIINDFPRIEDSGKLLEEDAPSGPCLPGQLRIMVNATGEFYPCERVSELSSIMCIGNLTHGVNYEKAQRILNVGSVSDAVCKTCWCFRHCTICAKKADAGEDKLSKAVKLGNCASTKKSVVSKVRHYLLFKEINLLYSDLIRIPSSKEVF